MNSGIYQIVNTKNNKIYIGSSKNCKKRIITHFSLLRNNKHKNKHLQSAYNKYGKENFNASIIELCKIEDLFIREQYYVDYYKSQYVYIDNIKECILYNIKLEDVTTSKGRIGFSHTDETKKIISNKNKGLKRTDETKQKLRESKLGKSHPIHPNSKLALIKERQTRKINYKNNIKVPKQKNKKIYTIEEKKKISNSKIGNKNPMFGINGEKSPSHKLNEIEVVEIINLIKLGVLLKDIAKKYNVNYRTISSIKMNKTWKHIKR